MSKCQETRKKAPGEGSMKFEQKDIGKGSIEYRIA